MDGTIANLYAVEGWLPKLRAFDASPYIEAKPMLNMAIFARLLHKAQRLGYRIGIISWAGIGADEKYLKSVINAKVEWLETHLPSVKFDEIKITYYGVSKSQTVEYAKESILFDDNAEVRAEWVGVSYTEQEILAILRELK